MASKHKMSACPVDSNWMRKNLTDNDHAGRQYIPKPWYLTSRVLCGRVMHPLTTRYGRCLYNIYFILASSFSIATTTATRPCVVAGRN
jgi:hypothetical protein